MEIFKKLESLGFFEWLKEKGFGSGFTPMILDAQPFDSIERSGYNAIALRCFRDNHDLWSSIQKYPTSENPKRCYYELRGDNINTDKDEPKNSYMSGWFDTYELAELACLKKLIEIIKKNNEKISL